MERSFESRVRARLTRLLIVPTALSQIAARLLVGETRRADEKQGLALVGRQLRERHTKFQVVDRRSVQGAVLPMMLSTNPIYFVPYARSPASPRPGTMNARSSRDSSIAAVQIGTSGWAPRIRSMP
jgi:hypothetical protein